jgi:hypothetical protein
VSGCALASCVLHRRARPTSKKKQSQKEEFLPEKNPWKNQREKIITPPSRPTCEKNGVDALQSSQFLHQGFCTSA